MKRDLHDDDRLDAGAEGVSRSVYARRMLDPREHPRAVRIAARCVCHALVMFFQASTAVCTWLRGARASRRAKRGLTPFSRVVVTGTFFADSWIEAHVRPLALAGRCEHVWVVADRPFAPMARVSYVCPPRWLQRVCGRVGARSLAFVAVCLLKRPDVVGGFHLLCNGLLAQLVARLVGARAMYFCVGGWAEFLNGAVHGGNRAFTRIGRPDPVLERRLLRSIDGFDLILTMGTKARRFMQERGVGVPIEVMSGGIDGGRYTGSSGETRYDLITVRRVEPVKRLDVLLETVRLVAQRVPTVKLAIVGDGAELENLQALARALGIADNVDFVGRHSDVERWLAKARIFVLTSDSEGLSLALMEAVTAGLPAVVSDVGDLADLVVDGVNGYRPPPRQPQRFADHICALLGDQDHYERFSAAAREAAGAYTVEAMRERWDAILARWGFAPLAGGAARLSRLVRRGWPSRKQVWESSRAWTRRPIAAALSAVHPTTWLGRRFRGQLEQLEGVQHWDAERLAGYQLQQVRRMLTRAQARSPYYRRLFRDCDFDPRDVSTLDDIAGLPTLDRTVLESCAEDLLTVGADARHVDYVTTGGTGGRPTRFCIDRGRSPAEFAHLVASWARCGFRLGQPLAVFRGHAVPTDRSGVRHVYEPLLRQHCYSSFHLADHDIERYLAHISGLGSCYLHVYPSVVAALARWLRHRERRAPENIRGILAESEIVYPQQRTVVEAAFGARYFACYGQSEKVVLAAECEHGSDYHVWPTYGYFELLAVDGSPVRTPGERGEIVGTGFLNTVMPFIRYRTGDFATWVGPGCADCGRQHPVIRDIGGHRTQELLVLSDGSTVPWAALNVHDDTFGRVRRFQFVQRRPGAATLCVVPAEGFCAADRRRILERLGRCLDDRLDIELRCVSDIAPSPRGKAVYVEQHLAV